MCSKKWASGSAISISRCCEIHQAKRVCDLPDRVHPPTGRNYKNWFTENRQTGDRYNYLYSLDELEPWVERARVVAKRTKDTCVVTNNHFLGKAIVNAFEMVSLLFGRPVAVPSQLKQHYLILEQITAVKRDYFVVTLALEAPGRQPGYCGR